MKNLLIRFIAFSPFAEIIHFVQRAVIEVKGLEQFVFKDSKC